VRVQLCPTAVAQNVLPTGPGSICASDADAAGMVTDRLFMRWAHYRPLVTLNATERKVWWKKACAVCVKQQTQRGGNHVPLGPGFKEPELTEGLTSRGRGGKGNPVLGVYRQSTSAAWNPIVKGRPPTGVGLLMAAPTLKRLTGPKGISGAQDKLR